MKRARAAGSDDEDGAHKRAPPVLAGPPTITYYQHYHGPVNHIGVAHNANLGINNGSFSQATHGPPSGTAPAWRPPIDLTQVLNPILDASHTRNLKVSPPHSKCLEGTRQEVIAMVLARARAPLEEAEPHILWIYGYAGCGKSAISQAVAEQLAQEGLLAASFFFFRGTGDRSSIIRFVNTIAHQLARAKPDTATLIEHVAKADPGLLSVSTSSLVAQFQHLVLHPIVAISPSLSDGPLIIVLDGVDECRDKEEVATLIEDLISYFNKNPFIPVRFVIASRVEDHIHQELHSSSQVHLLDLVKHTSNQDIEVALNVCITKEKHGRVLAHNNSWPSAWDKQQLLKCIGGSYIFMTTIIKLLFAPSIKDGLTPMERLPQLLEMKPNFDSLYREILEPCSHFPFFLNIISTIALAFEPLSIAQIVELLDIKTFHVTNILINLHAIMRVPGDDHSPVTLWHTSLRDFLCSEDHAMCFFASPIHHRCIADGAIRVATSSSLSKSHQYARKYGMEHLFQYLKSIDQEKTPYDVLLGGIMLNLVKATFQDDKTALEAACCAKEWKLVQALVNAGANVNTQFQGKKNDIRVALHAACHYKAKEMVYFLLEKGADPNIAASWSYDLSSWGFYAFPLAWAAAQGDADLVNRLLACGADPNLKGGRLGSALHVCARYGMDEVARFLLEHGADVNIKDDDDWTPLYWASWQGYIKVAKCLLEFNADPNLQDNDGDTPLHDACNWGRVEIAECLLEHNADPSIRNKWGQTALQTAQESRWGQNVVEMLHWRGIME